MGSHGFSWVLMGSHGFQVSFQIIEPSGNHHLKPLKPRLTQHICDLCGIRELTTGTAGRLWQQMAANGWEW